MGYVRDGGPMFRWRSGGGKRRGRWRSSRRKGTRCRPWSSKAAPSPRLSGARRGARTSNAIAISRTACRAARTYVRNGSVVDLQIAPGEIQAMVSGSELYKVAVKVTPVSKARWQSICKDCAGAIDSLVELLQGRFSKGVMERSAASGPACFRRRMRSSFRAVARTGPRCASTWRRCCMASARGSTGNPNCCSACMTSTRRN